MLTLFAAGADIVDVSTHGAIGHVARSLAPGLILVALIFSLSGISGAHLNPAVTLAFVARQDFPAKRALGYWVCQVAGGIAAGLLLRALFGAAVARDGAPQLDPAVSAAAGLAIEGTLTLILVFVIVGTSEQPAVVGKNAALAVGFTVAACGLASSVLTGAAMNPARSLGPQVASGSYAHWWVYVAGPCLGALAATAAVHGIYGPPTRTERDAAHGKHA